MKKHRNHSFLVLFNLIFILLVQNVYAMPPIQIPIDLHAKITFYSRRLVPNPLDSPPKAIPVHLDKMEFQQLPVQKGQKLQIDSLVLSENTLAIFSGLTRGTDALQAGDLQSTMDTHDPRQFLKLILEVARLRRHAESVHEWETILKTVKESRAQWNAYLFKTDYVTIIVSQSSESDTPQQDIKYYVPLEEIFAGAGEIDLDSAKLAIVQSMSLKVLEGFGDTDDFKEADTLKTQLKEMFKSLHQICKLKDHKFTGESPVGCFITDCAFLHCAGRKMKFSESDHALLQLRKQIVLLQNIKKLFPTLPGLEELEDLEAFTQYEKFQINCQDNEFDLFNGLIELESE